MATKKVAPKAEENKDALEGMNEALSRSEQFIEKNQNTLLIALAAVIVVVGGILLYNNKVVLPKEQKAAEMIFVGEQYFAADSLDKALYGDDDVDYIGFEEIAKKYAATKTGKLAKAYAGLCYKEKGEYETAVSYLSKANTSSLVAGPAFVGALGDCYVELGQVQKAASCFDKAAKTDNNLLAPIYLMKAGRAYESLGQWSKALAAYETIKAQYPSSLEGSEIEKYIERAKLQK